MTLWQTRGFAPLCSIIFLNAFIDLGHKITIQNIIFKLYDGSEQIVLTAIVNALILLPYILFFIPSGRASDSFSKYQVLRVSSIATVIITIALAFFYQQGAFWPAFSMTFLLAIQSAFFGPAKLGYLKELVANKRLSKANGAAQALTTLGILMGTLVFSIAFESRFNEQLNTASNILSTMTPLAIALIVLALLQCAITCLLPKTCNTAIHLATLANTIPSGSVKRLYQGPVLWPTVVGMTAFWCIGQMLLATYPAFAKDNMGITNTIVIQGLLSMIAIGIMLGSALAGILSKQAVELALLPISSLMIIVCLAAIPLTTSLLFAWPLFLATGVAGGLFIVPLMTSLQILSKAAELGSNLSANNLVQNIAMTSCLAFTAIAAFYAMPSQWILSFILLIALSSLSYLLWRMPQSIRSLKTFRYRVQLHDELSLGFHPYKNYCYITNGENNMLTQQALTKISPTPLIQHGNYFFNNSTLNGEKVFCTATITAANCIQLTLKQSATT